MTISNVQLEASLRKNAAILTLVAEELGTSRQNVHQRVNRSPHLQAVIREVEEKLLDLAEGQVAKAIQKGQGPTVRWYLERKGKARGYANKTEVSFDEGAVEAIVAGLGGNLDQLRQARDRLAQAVETGGS